MRGAFITRNERRRYTPTARAINMFILFYNFTATYNLLYIKTLECRGVTHVPGRDREREKQIRTLFIAPDFSRAYAHMFLIPI